MSYFLKDKQDIFCLFSIHVEQLSYYFSRIFSNHLSLMENLFLSSYIYKKFNSVFICSFFLFLHDLTPLLQHIKSLLSFYRYYLLLLFCFFFIWENLNLIHQASDLFYGIYNKINEHNRRQTYYLSLIPNYFDIYL